jgi:Tol biopolymer transport system component
VYAGPMSPAADVLVVEVTAADIATPIAQNFDVVDGAASGTITVPAGSDRTITARTYDAGSIETHRGSTTVDVAEGSNPTVTVTLMPLVGDQPIDMIIGSVTVDVLPATDTLGRGDTLRLTAVVVDGVGDTLDVSVAWATLNPSLALVDTAGLVTGISSGTVTIVGMYAGVGDAAVLEIAPPTLMVFNSLRDGNEEIYRMMSDGSSQARLAAHTAGDHHPSLSPDRTKIAFSSLRDGAGGDDIWVMDADGTNLVQLTSDGAWWYAPVWSPDGSKLAYCGGVGTSGQEIWVMNPDGSGKTRLTTNGASDCVPTWSADGTKIAFMSDRDGDYEIYSMNADGSSQAALTNNTARDAWPRWSPDGSTIAFDSDRDGNKEIYVMDADGSNPTRLTTDGAQDENPAWSSDGTQIAFTSLRDGNWEIYIMDPDGSNATRITTDTGHDLHPSWSGN